MLVDDFIAPELVHPEIIEFSEDISLEVSAVNEEYIDVEEQKLRNKMGANKFRD